MGVGSFQIKNLLAEIESNMFIFYVLGKLIYHMNSVRYLSFEDAMRVCSELGDLNSHLVPFVGPEEFEFFYEKSKVNPAVQRYCNHGDRKMFWLPYRNRCFTSFKEISVRN